MGEPLEVAVVGAGPFGLSVAAHLQRRSVRVFGEEFATWRNNMPRGMTLRSAWNETSLSEPGAKGTIDDWVRETGQDRVEPIPLELFIRYGGWFAERFVADRDPDDVTRVELQGPGFRLTTESGDHVDARRIVIAVGVMPFAYVPPALGELFGGAVRLATGDPNNLAHYAGRRLLVVGGGQAGLETAGLAARAGARVELVSRSRIHWFADREPHTPRHGVRERVYRLAYPAVGYGPPPLNRLVLHPDLYAMLPRPLRGRLSKRLLRPGGSAWLRPLVDADVRIRECCEVQSAEVGRDCTRVQLTDGSEGEFDDVLVACGYRFSLDQLGFLSDDVKSRIGTRDNWPVLDRFFRSTDERVMFVGYPAEGRFGPISRFVLGADFTARRVGELLAP